MWLINECILSENKIRDLFKVKLYTIRKREREKKRERERKK